MNRWQRLWLSVKLLAAVAACLAASALAFLYMMDSPDAARIHPLSILVVGLIFGFITFGVLTVFEKGGRALVTPRQRAVPVPQANLEQDADFEPEQPFTMPMDDSSRQKH
ncbi:hypothetical protein EJA72_14950 [Pseudomonas sp. PB120]|uniref:hypothetical protein n=1 Tax=Pseudomonas sp. PB120 TaxID=2494700 RepID=UPI0012FD1DA0|nr:hypothetical protein [Pseudomonas sp. PB120]MVV49525.1 hypothetical protein [Pseudomonas sp. PB120]